MGKTLTELYVIWEDHPAFRLDRQAVFSPLLKAVKSCRNLKTFGLRYDASLEGFDDIVDVLTLSDLSDLERMCTSMVGQLPARTTLPKLADFLIAKKVRESLKDNFKLSTYL